MSRCFAEPLGYQLRKRDDEKMILWRTLDQSVIRQTWETHLRSDPMNVHCRSLIMKAIGTDIEFVKNDVVMQPKDTFKTLVESEWKTFVTDVYDSIQTTGIVPVTFVPASGSEGHYTPKVPRYGTYIIQVAYIIEMEKLIYRVLRPRRFFFDPLRQTTDRLGDPTSSDDLDNHHRRWTVEDTRIYASWAAQRVTAVLGSQSMWYRNSPISSCNGRDGCVFCTLEMNDEYVLDRSTFVLDGFGSDPSVDGSLTTKLASLLPDRQYTSVHAQIMLSNQMQQVTKPLFLQEESPDTEKMDTMMRGFRAGSYRTSDITSPSYTGSSGSSSNSEKFQRDRSSLRALAQVLEQYHFDTAEQFHIDVAAGSGCHRGGGNVVSDAITTCGAAPQRVAPIPSSYTMPNGQRVEATLGQRYFDLRAILDEHISNAYGIPIALIRNTGLVRGNLETMEQFFQGTVRGWSDIMGRVLTFAYRAIYGPSEYEEGVAQMCERFGIDGVDKAIIRFDIDRWLDSSQKITTRHIDTLDPSELSTKLISDARTDDVYDDDDDEYDTDTTSKDGAKKRGRESDEDVVDTTDDDVDEDTTDDDVDEDTPDRILVPEIIETSHPESLVSAEVVTKVDKRSKRSRQASTESHPRKPELGHTFSVETGLPHSALRMISPVDVCLKSQSETTFTLLTFAFTQGALLKSEYYSAIRSQLGFEVSEEVIKELSEEKFNDLKRETEITKKTQDKPKAGAKATFSSSSASSSSKSKGGSGNWTAPRSERKRTAKKLGSSGTGGSGVASATNQKRSVANRRTQVSNAESGRKASSKAKPTSARH
jgi:hypothetical protein